MKIWDKNSVLNTKSWGIRRLGNKNSQLYTLNIAPLREWTKVSEKGDESTGLDGRHDYNFN